MLDALSKDTLSLATVAVHIDGWVGGWVDWWEVWGRIIGSLHIPRNVVIGTSELLLWLDQWVVVYVWMNGGREGSLYVQMDGCVVDVWIGGGREVCIDAFAVG